MATGFDDFSTSGNWTQDRDATNTTWTFASASLTPGGGNGVEGLSLNAVDSDANRDNFNILVKVQVTSGIGAAGQFVAFARGTTGGSGPNRYAVRMGGGNFRTYKYVNSTTPTQISTVTTTNFDATGTYWIEFDGQGTTIRARIWKDGTTKPSTWNSNTTDNAGVTATDSTISGVGWMGVMASTSSTANKKWINGFGWGTNGDTAPDSGSSVTTITASPGTYTWAGTTANIPLLISASPGAYTWAGTTATTSQLINASVGAYTWAGTTATLTQLINASVGAYSWAGTTSTLSQLINASPGTYTWAGTTSAIAGSVITIDASVGAYTWAGTTATIPVLVNASPGTYTWAGTTSTFGGGLVTITGHVGVYSWAGTTSQIIGPSVSYSDNTPYYLNVGSNLSIRIGPSKLSNWNTAGRPVSPDPRTLKPLKSGTAGYNVETECIDVWDEILGSWVSVCAGGPPPGVTVISHSPGVYSWTGTTAQVVVTTSSGTVTSVGLADGSTVPIYGITGSPVTSTGTITETLVDQSANTVFAGSPIPGVTAQPEFRALVPADLPPIDVQTFSTPGSYTWTKPAGATFIHVIIRGGGGGGGSGQAKSANPGVGASGGGGAAARDEWFDASSLGSTETVLVGAGGAGAAGVTTNAAGGPGTAGGVSTFAGLSAYGGGGGHGYGPNNAAGGGGGGLFGTGANAVADASVSLGGISTGQTAQSSADGGYMTLPFGGSGGACAQHAFGAAHTPGISLSGCNGGGHGGDVSSGPFLSGGSAYDASGTLSVVGGTAGNPGGSASGIAATYRGAGGGGGGAKTSGGAAPGSGGAGQQPGGGGGGGGGTDLDGQTSGAGGNGGDGIVVVITYF